MKPNKFQRFGDNFNQQAKEHHQFISNDCKLEQCPSYMSCPKMGSHLRRFFKKDVKVFFVFDAPTPEEVRSRVPATSQGGRLFRKKFLPPLMEACGMFSYYITYMLKNSTKTDAGSDREPSQKEYKTCWAHFRDDLTEYKPEVIVAFGSKVFSQLVDRASNKAELHAMWDGEGGEESITKLRGKFYPMVLEGRTVHVMPTYSPNFINKVPSAVHLLYDDRDRLVPFLREGKIPSATECLIKVGTPQLLKTQKEVYEFFDFLQWELPEHSVVAFDSETNNLNRCFNNKFLTWQFCWDDAKSAVFPIQHPEMPLFEDPEARAALAVRAGEFFNATPNETSIDWILAHNAKFDLSVMYGLMNVLPREKGCIPWWDTMLAMHWLNENRKAMSGLLNGKPYSLKTLGTEIFNFKFKSEILEARADGELGELEFEDLTDYGATDVILTRALFYEQLRRADLQPENARFALERFVRCHYWPAVRAVAVMETNGLWIRRSHIDYLQGSHSPIWNRMAEIEKIELQNRPEVLEFREKHRDVLSGTKTNIEYEDDLWDDGNDGNELPLLNLNKKEQQKAFYLDFLMLQPLKNSEATGEASLDKKFLDHYSLNYTESPIIKANQAYVDFYTTKDEDGDAEKNPIHLDIEYRQLKRLGTAYSNSMQEMLDDPKGDCLDGKIRANFHLSGTDTGRLASSNPNFQNLPAGRTKAAKEIKNMFQAQPPSEEFPLGTYLIQADYATAEVIWAGIAAQEPRFTDGVREANELLEMAYSSDSLTDKEFEDIILSTDFHKRTASLMFGVPAEQVLKPQRQASKAITFGLLFGKAVESLSKEQGWSNEEGQKKFDMFFSAFPKLKAWLDQQTQVARKRGYVETLMGRRRRLDHLYDMDDFRNAGDADRRAMNSPIQGQSSDAGMIGLFGFMNYTLRHGLEKRWKILNMVHDSILVQVPVEDVRDVLPILKMYLTTGMKKYIERNWELDIPVSLRADFEIGVRYGDFTNWDQRQRTLDSVLEKVAEKAKDLWFPKKKEELEPLLPPSVLDLVHYEPQTCKSVEEVNNVTV